MSVKNYTVKVEGELRSYQIFSTLTVNDLIKKILEFTKLRGNVEDYELTYEGSPLNRELPLKEYKLPGIICLKSRDIAGILSVMYEGVAKNRAVYVGEKMGDLVERVVEKDHKDYEVVRSGHVVDPTSIAMVNAPVTIRKKTVTFHVSMTDKGILTLEAPQNETVEHFMRYYMYRDPSVYELVAYGVVFDPKKLLKDYAMYKDAMLKLRAKDSSRFARVMLDGDIHNVPVGRLTVGEIIKKVILKGDPNEYDMFYEGVKMNKDSVPEKFLEVFQLRKKPAIPAVEIVEEYQGEYLKVKKGVNFLMQCEAKKCGFTIKNMGYGYYHLMDDADCLTCACCDGVAKVKGVVVRDARYSTNADQGIMSGKELKVIDDVIWVKAETLTIKVNLA
ncbi:hypothetical protein BNJ_00007 [Kaumoebavirus]|uniref:hypothetical protein n=1 Tax=Kaumoebavirus TaxID=1859492 RepID=UPI0009C34EF7|nr:hypothetical protein BNJ_00007 [Kaumoebavirus]ARA71854.1 hypothetical protein BNJ_00007 [Kaumoebavirus]